MHENAITLNLQYFAEESEGANEMDFAEPSETDITEGDTEGTETEEVEGTATNDDDVQTAEENAKYAAARRRAEVEFENKMKARDAEYARRFADYENPITHQPILSEKDYFAALDAQETLKRNNELRNKGIDPQMFEDMVNKQVNNNPAVLQANKILEQTREVQIMNDMDNDLKAIQRMNPDIKSFDDIANADNFSTILGYFNSGLSMPDAYKLANFDTLIANNNASAKQKAINSMKGTQHLNTTDGVSSSDDSGVDIPQSELGAWRRAYPDLSLKELRKKYNRIL